MQSETIEIPRTGRDERRDAILKIAHAAFLADGYAATSMSSIATKVGGSKATLYNYFTSKEELFVAVIDEKCREFHALIFDAESGTGDMHTVLTRLGEQLVRFMLDDEKIATYRLVTAETGRFPELGRAFYQSGPMQGQQLFARFFDRAISEGHLKPADTRTMAQHFFTLCKGEIHHRKLWGVTPNPTDEEIRAHVADAIRVFLAAYGRQEAGQSTCA